MQFAVTGLTVVLPTTFVEYGKKEGAVVKGAVFDGTKPVLTRDGSNFSGFTSQKSSKSFSQRSRNSQGSSPQHLGCRNFDP